MPHGLIPYLIPLVVVALYARRAFRARRITASRMWIGPAYLGVALIATMANAPMPDLLGMSIFAVAAALGVGAGYLRALHQEFSVDPKTGAVTSKATPLGSMLFLGILVVRLSLDFYLHGGFGPPAHGIPAVNPHTVQYVDALLIFAFAMIAASAWELYRRARPLLAAKASASVPEARP